MSNAHGDKIGRRAATGQTIDQGRTRKYTEGRTKPSNQPAPVSLWPATLLGLAAITGFVILIFHVSG